MRAEADALHMCTTRFRHQDCMASTEGLRMGRGFPDKSKKGETF